MVTIEDAQGIMGRHVLGIDAAHAHIKASKGYAVTTLARIPFSGEDLERCRETHLLVAGLPVRPRDLWTEHPHLFSQSSIQRHDNQALSWEPVPRRWYLIRREPEAGSFNHTFEESWDLLGERERLPRVCEVVYAVVLHELTNGERLLKQTYVRCQDHIAGGNVYVGYTFPGLQIDSYWGGEKGLNLGVIPLRTS
jgi:hypothetical protein